MINNIDVTLRDGGYQNKFRFSIDYAIRHAQKLAQSGVEWIEIGYRNGSFKPIEGIGLTGISTNNYIKLINDSAPDVKIVIIAHPNNITIDDLIQMKNCGVSLLRLCIQAENPKPALDLCKFAQSINLKISINFVRVSQIGLCRLIELAVLCQKAGAWILYLADSNGSMLPKQVANLVTILKNLTSLNIGFHAHDNLGLSMVNSIEAVNAGATFIDSSITGMGKGSGNLVLEIWLTYLNSIENSDHYNIEMVLEQVKILRSQDFFKASQRDIIDIVMGYKNLNADYRKSIENIFMDGIYSSLTKVESLIGDRLL